MNEWHSGFVNYQSYGDASAAGLAYTTNGQIYMGVDYTTARPASPGRKSVRVTSNRAYNHGLFIADIAHMPGSICGVWPAYCKTIPVLLVCSNRNKMNEGI